MSVLARLSLALVLALALGPGAAADEHRAGIETLRERIGDGPGAPADWRALGDALAATGEIEDALAAYRTALDGGVDEPLEVAVAMADLSRLRDLYVEADALLEGVLDDYDPQSGDAAATLAAGNAAARLGEREPDYLRTALDLYEHAIRLDPSDPAPKIALGELLLDKYNNAEALPLFREVLAADPDNAAALLGLARSEYFDHSSAAVDTVRRVLELEPDNAEARVLLGRMLLEAADFDGVAAEADAVLGVNPRHPGAWTLRAALAMLRADQETFDAHVATVFEHAPGYREAWVTLAEIAAENRLYSLAVQFSQAVVRRYPDYWPAYALLGLNQYRLGQIIWGRRNLETAFRGDPYNVWIKNTLELMDRADTFATLNEGRFTLAAPGRDAQVLAPILFPLAEAAYDALAERYGHEPRTPVRIEFYDRRDDFSVRTVGLVGVDIVGVSFGPVVSLVSPADMDGPLNWGSVLWHELAHTFHMSMSGWRVPRWFTEGLSVVEERLARPGWGADVSPGFLEAWAGDRLPPVSRLDEAFIRPTYPNQVVHAYFLGSLLVEYIEERAGVGAITAMLGDYGEGRDSQSLFAEHLGMAGDELDRAFEVYVNERFAHAIDALGLGESKPDEDGDYRALRAAGTRAFDSGEIDEAVATLRKARRLVPEFAGEGSPYHVLARIHRAEGRTAAAIAELEAAVAVDGEQVAPLKELSELYLEASRPHAAAGALERALFIDPFDRALRETLADIHEDTGTFDAAVTQRRAILALEPADVVGARYRLAHSMHAAGEHEAARGEVLRVLEEAPLYDDALDLLLEVRAALGHDDLADARDGAAADQSATPTPR